MRGPGAEVDIALIFGVRKNIVVFERWYVSAG
jgi:hypothetical protein